jgi:hypothetical protein
MAYSSQGRDMNSKVTLTSLAMLKVDLDRKRDYIEYLRPFVVHTLREYKPVPITDRGTQELVAKEFGLILPARGIQIVLNRLVKNGFLTKREHVWQVNQDLPDPGVPQRRVEGQTHINEVISELTRYCSEELSATISEEEAVTTLVAFLAEFGIHCLRAYLRGTALPDVPPNSPKAMYLVGRFITHAMKEDRALFESVIVLVKGQMLANALICPDLEGLDKAFERIVFYLDTPLVLRLLGLEGEAKQLVVDETLSLIRRLAGKTAVFDHTRQEIYKVIQGIENNLENPHAHGRIVLEMRRQRRQRSDLTLMGERLDSWLQKNNIAVRDTPPYEIKLQIDERALQATLDKEIEYLNPGALLYDIQSVRSIYVLRKGKAPRRLEDAPAVLLTSNRDLAQAAFTFGKIHESTREVSSVVTDFSVANVAWLKAPLGAPSLPEKEVLAYCYAALEPGEAIWEAYLKEVDKLEKDGELEPRDHQLLRFSPQVRDELMNLTLGDVQELTNETVTEILRRVESEVASEKDTQLAQEQAKHEETLREKSRVEREHYAIQARLYWMADRVGRLAAWATVVLLGLGVLVASLASVYAMITRLGWHWWMIVVFIVLGALFVALRNLILLVRLRPKMKEHVCCWVFKWLAGSRQEGTPLVCGVSPTRPSTRGLAGGIHNQP